MLDSRDVLIYVAIAEKGDWDNMFRRLKDRNELPDPEVVAKAVASYPGKAITVFDREYPACLRNSPRAPFVLFYEGDISLLSQIEKFVCITGSHEPESPYVEEMVGSISKEITKRGAIVISGLSRSCQSIALSSAISEGQCVAVLSSGSDFFYPAESEGLQRRIAKKGLLLSPFPRGVAPSVEGVRLRNILLGELASFLFVGAVKKADGVLLTMASALNMGIDAGCLPFPANSVFMNNALIRNGAAMIESADDLLFEAGIDRQEEGK